MKNEERTQDHLRKIAHRRMIEDMNSNEELIEINLQAIKQHVTRLLELLPDEQQHVGSELQQIDSLANDLYYKYVVKGIS